MAKDLTEEQKKLVLEQLKKFIDVHKEIRVFEKELAEAKLKHERVLKKLEKIRDEEKAMVDGFDLDEEGKVAYNKFVNTLLMKEIEIK